jgi:putative ATP-dependent endonuclease of OLD family
MAPRLDRLIVKNLRSIGGDGVEVKMPTNGPLVLLGENNAGKSNIVRAIDLLFGERWPGTFEPDDHDFFGRDPDGIEIRVEANISGIVCQSCNMPIGYVKWSYDKSSSGNPCTYLKRCACWGTYPSKEFRQQLFAMPIGADRRLSYQLSYQSKYTFLSRLMHRFHDCLVADSFRVAELKKIFDYLLAQFSQVKEIKDFRRLLRTTSEDFGQNLAYALDIDFSAYDPSNFYRSLRVHPQLAGDVRSFDELGTGQEQVLALAFAYAYAKSFGAQSGLILAVDEPEAHLHPLAQQWLASRLNRLATDGLQVVVTTHSPHFVDLSRPENLVIVRKDGPSTQTRVTQVDRTSLAAKLVARGADSARTQADTVGPFYAASATEGVLTALFSRACVLVEGTTESLALPPLLALAGLDPLKAGIAVVSVNGVGNVAKWHRLFSILGVPTYCIFDTDSDKTGVKASELLTKRTDIMTALGRNSPEVDA